MNAPARNGITCYHCGKGIIGGYVAVQPSNIAIALGDFAKSFHPKCHEKAERAAAKALNVPFQYTRPE